MHVTDKTLHDVYCSMPDEMLEMAGALDAHGLITKPDMVQIRGLCQKPPVFTPGKVALIRKNKARMSQSVFASLLNVSVSTVQKWEAPDAESPRLQ